MHRCASRAHGRRAERSDERFTAIRDQLSEALVELREATSWLLARENPNDVLSGAAPYLELLGIVGGGFYLARLAIAADSSDDAWLDAKIDTAVFYATNILPGASGLRTAAGSGASTLFAIDSADLAAK